jgi:ribonuclease HI
MAAGTQLTVYTDGASRGNPGEAAWAYVIERDEGDTIEEANRLGLATNNQAEYTALVRALEHALELGRHHRVVVHSDSELMVKQLNGEYRVKNEDLLPLYEQARALARRFDHPVVFKHVRRGQNARADQLCNEALDGLRDSVRGMPGVPRPQLPPPPARPRLAPAAAPVPAAPQGLHEEAVACLRDAAAAWQRGQGEKPEEVWKRLAAILRRHWDKLLAGPGP